MREIGNGKINLMKKQTIVINPETMQNEIKITTDRFRGDPQTISQ